MRMKATVCGYVIEFDRVSILDEVWGSYVVISIGAIYRLSIETKWRCLILDEPQVILVLVRIQSDLLLVAASWIHEVVRMQVASLRIVMSDADPTSKCNIDGNILHSLRVQSGLEFGTHESVPIARIYEASEMDPKHS